MKTKYNPSFIIGGVLLAVAVGSNVGRSNAQGEWLANIILTIFAILSIGYGLRLRLLAKKGIEDTRAAENKKVSKKHIQKT